MNSFSKSEDIIGNNMNYTVRYATEEDQKYFRNILLNDKESRKCLGLSGGSEKAVIPIAEKWDISLVACEGNNICGFVSTSFSTLALKSYIDELYVIEEHRKKGVGGILLKKSIEYAFEEWGGNGIRLLTVENTPMENLAQKNGFVNMGTYKGFNLRGNTYHDQTLWEKSYADFIHN